MKRGDYFIVNCEGKKLIGRITCFRKEIIYYICLYNDIDDLAYSYVEDRAGRKDKFMKKSNMAERLKMINEEEVFLEIL